MALQTVYAQLRDWASVTDLAFEDCLQTEILPAYPTLGVTLGRQNMPALILNPGVKSWVGNARDTDRTVACQVFFLALRRTAGFEEDTERLKAGI